jgi:hypothetical protein
MKMDKNTIFNLSTVHLFATEIAKRMNFLGYDTTYSVSLTEFSGPTISAAIRGNTEKEGWYIVEHGMFHDARKGFEVNFTIGLPSPEGDYISEWVSAKITRIRLRDYLETEGTLYSVPTLEVYSERFGETAAFYSAIPTLTKHFDVTVENVKADMDSLINLFWGQKSLLSKIEDPDCAIEEFNNLLVELGDSVSS